MNPILKGDTRHFLLSVLAAVLVFAAWGWVSHNDYIEAKRIECLEAGLGYDPKDDVCTETADTTTNKSPVKSPRVPNGTL